MDLKSLVKTIQEFEGVSRKSSINNVISLLKESYHVSGNVVIDIGDDASAIDIGNNQVVLVAADGIWGQIMNVNPYWAGYCAVLVNVNSFSTISVFTLKARPSFAHALFLGNLLVIVFPVFLSVLSYSW